MDRPNFAQLSEYHDVTLYGIIHKYIGYDMTVRPENPERDKSDGSARFYYADKLAEEERKLAEFKAATDTSVVIKARYELITGVRNLREPRDAEVIAEYVMVIEALRTLDGTPLQSSAKWQITLLQERLDLLTACVPLNEFDASTWKAAKIALAEEEIKRLRKQVADERKENDKHRKWKTNTLAEVPDRVIRKAIK